MARHLREPASDAEPVVSEAGVPEASPVAESWSDYAEPVRAAAPIIVEPVAVTEEVAGTGYPVATENVTATDDSASAEEPVDDDDAPRTTGLGLLKETLIIVISALIVSWLIKTFLVQAFYIPSESMEDTFERGDRVMVSRLVPRVRDIHRGDIVVFKDPGDWLDPRVEPDRGFFHRFMVNVFTGIGLLPQDSGEHLVKRAIGLPGDYIACCDDNGQVMVNGVSIDERLYLRPGAIPSQINFEATVPDGMLFVMGDNRQNSADSRFHTDGMFGGFVPIDNVVGTAFATVWPLDRAHILHNPGSVFAPVVSQQ